MEEASVHLLMPSANSRLKLLLIQQKVYQSTSMSISPLFALLVTSNKNDEVSVKKDIGDIKLRLKKKRLDRHSFSVLKAARI